MFVIGIEPILFPRIAGQTDGTDHRSIAKMDIIRIPFAFIGAATMLAVVAIAILGRENDRLNEGLLIGIYVGALGSISVLFVLRHLGLF